MDYWYLWKTHFLNFRDLQESIREADRPYETWPSPDAKERLYVLEDVGSGMLCEDALNLPAEMYFQALQMEPPVLMSGVVGQVRARQV